MQKSKSKICICPLVKQEANKKGQMKLSFGMIFSIILIIIFIAFAAYGITKFLNLQRTIQTEGFVDKFQSDVKSLWGGNYGSKTKEYVVSKKITEVCFKDPGEYGNENMELKEEGKPIGKKYEIKYLDTNKGIFSETPPCIQNINGKVKINLQKKFGENLITITKE